MPSKVEMWLRIKSVTGRRWPEWFAFAFFLALSLGSLLGPLLSRDLAGAQYALAFNTALSVGTSGVVSFIFYYVVNERIERRRRELVRNGALRAYRDAKRHIVIAVLHASQKGGRTDIHADTETIDGALTLEGFRALFSEGREADEGFYAFQNQMSDQTPEYDEIIFNLRAIGRAFDRMIDNTAIDDPNAYDRFVRLDALVRRIEHNGAGYDESKALCSLVWQIFAGWSTIDGWLDHDPIERAIEAA